MGEDQRRAPLQLLVLVNKFVPLSPSTAVSLLPLMYQTTASAVPSVVVLIGEVTSPVCGAHQSPLPVSGLPVSSTETILAPEPVVGQPAALVAEKVTCVPSAVR